MGWGVPRWQVSGAARPLNQRAMFHFKVPLGERCYLSDGLPGTFVHQSLK